MKEYTLERQAINFIRTSNRSGSHNSCARLFPNNTTAHEIAKCLITLQLLRQGHTVFTEAILQNGVRPDILDATAGILYEILETETVEECTEKAKTYPEFFDVVPIKAETVIKEFIEKYISKYNKA